MGVMVRDTRVEITAAETVMMSRGIFLFQR
jgi:hypothetical protein